MRVVKKLIVPGLMLIVSLVSMYLLVGKSHMAKWWIIDDHEIVAYLGDDGKVKLGEIPELILKTEVGSPGKSGRYRPTYYTLRIVEAWLWGNHPERWYLSRWLMLSMAFFLFWGVFSYGVGKLVGYLWTMYLLTWGFWRDIVVRLGPSEIYVVLGLALFCYGFLKTIRVEPCRKWYWLMLLIGTILSVGAKENMVILLLPLSVLLVRALINLRQKKTAMMTLGLAMSFCIWVGGVVLIAMKNIGHDVYAQNTSAESRYVVLISGLHRYIDNWAWWLPLVVVIGTGWYIWRYHHSEFEKYRKIRLKFYLVWGMMGVLNLGQFVFYNGKWPSGNRYDFPGVLAEPIVGYGLFGGLVAVLAIWNRRGGIYWLKLAMVIWLIGVISRSGYRELRRAVDQNIFRTNVFTSNIKRVAFEISNDQVKPVVFYSYHPVDYEPLMSTAKFLKSMGAKNPLYVMSPLCTNQEKQNAWGRYLVDGICSWSVKGQEKIFKPKDTLAEWKGKYYCIGFSGEVVDEKCQNNWLMTTRGMSYELD